VRRPGTSRRSFPGPSGFLPTYTAEAQIFAQYLLENHPRSRIAVLYQEDGMGKEYLKGLKDGLGGKIAIVAEAPYKVTDTTIDAQMAKLKASGADVLIEFTTPKFAIMAIKRSAELGWRPLQFAASISNSYSAVIQPAGRKMRKACCRRHTGSRAKTRRRPARLCSANGAPSCSAISRA
jgi:ABC-type branched-subunit amino acid transport system substrate-binding protein